MISDIYKKSIVPKTTIKHKHRIDDEDDVFDYEYLIHKAQKLDESELQEMLTQVQDENGNFKEIDFDVESFLRELSTTTTTIPVPAATMASSSEFGSTSIKFDKTLMELIRICDAPIEKTTSEEYEIIEKEIQKISDELKETAKPSTLVNVSNTFEKSQEPLIENLRVLFNSLVFKTYDFSEGVFNFNLETILYEQLYKVNVYIKKTEACECLIYFGFPFYLSIRINMQGIIFISRKDIYKKLEKREPIEQNHYYSSNTGISILDVITASKFISLITSKNFASGFDLLSKLLHTIEQYKQNSETLEFNKLSINFERFVKLYKKSIKIVSVVPICE